MVKDALGIGLIGCGTVGSGVARLLLEQGDRLAERAGRRLELRRVVVRDLARERPVPRSLLTTDWHQVLRDPAIDLAVEVVGNVEWTRPVVLSLLEAGKDVVTANKALLAQHGPEVFGTARRLGRTIAFEAAVAGGIPIISALTQGLIANQILALQGILNGTSNFILTRMTEQGHDYHAALAEAQQHGYAEADPTLDVDGTDAAHKLAILAQLAFGVSVPLSAISRRGIADVDALDIRFARELGYTIKLLSEAWLHGDRLALHVSPVLLRQQAPLALVRGAYNAVLVVGDAVGDTLYYGQGAGQMPTASAVLADIIDLAIGRGQKTFAILKLGTDTQAVRIQPSDSVRSRFYLRLLVADRPGVLAEVAHVLGQHQISIASVIQHEVPEELACQRAQLVIMTHTAQTSSFRKALADLDRLASVVPPSVYYPVGD